jgi:hypothetical protein
MLYSCPAYVGRVSVSVPTFHLTKYHVYQSSLRKSTAMDSGQNRRFSVSFLFPWSITACSVRVTHPPCIHGTKNNHNSLRTVPVFIAAQSDL